MVKLMNSPVKSILVDHIRVPYNDNIKKLLLVERKSSNCDIYLNDKKIATQTVSEEFKKFAIKKGFTFKQSTKITLEGRKSIEGVKVHIQKNYDKQKVLREIVISVPASSELEMVSNRKTIIEWIKAFDSKIKLEGSIADKYVRC